MKRKRHPDWDSETEVLFQKLRRYGRMCSRFIKGKPNPMDAYLILKAAHHGVALALNAPKIEDRLLAIYYSTLKKPTIEDVTIEIGFATMFGIKPIDIAALVKRGLEETSADEQGKLIVPPEFSSRPNAFHVSLQPNAKTETGKLPFDFIDQFDIFFEKLVKEVNDARRLTPRIKKKKRKRELERATSAMFFGAGCAIANTYVITGMPTLSVSYSVSLASFHSAIRDIGGR